VRAVRFSRPDPLAVLLDGPIAVLYGPSESPRPVRFEFDPPFALPKPGRYFFAVKEDLCIAAFVILADSTASYAGGDAWQIHRGLVVSALGTTATICMALISSSKSNFAILPLASKRALGATSSRAIVKAKRR
jgi:hypothetical protein